MFFIVCLQLLKLFLFEFKYYEDLREVYEILKEGGLNEKFDVLNFFLEILVDEDGYC